MAARPGRPRRLLLAALLATVPWLAAGDPADDCVDLGDWRELVFTASKWGLDSRSVVRRQRLQDGRWLLTIETSYLGRTSGSAVTFDARGAVEESVSWRRSGKSSYWNHRHYADDGIHRKRRAPADKAEADREPDEWSQTEEKIEPYPPGIEQCGAVTETEVLLHLLSIPGVDLDAVCFLSGGEAFQVAVQEDPQEVILEDFAPSLTPVAEIGEDEPGTGPPPRLAPRAKKLGLRARPLSGGGASLRLLGLKGDLTIYLGTETSWPFRLEGRVPWAGRVAVALAEARFLPRRSTTAAD